VHLHVLVLDQDAATPRSMPRKIVGDELNLLCLPPVLSLQTLLSVLVDAIQTWRGKFPIRPTTILRSVVC